MKKIYGLMLVPVLALSGCASKISNEEAEKRAKEIAAHEVKDEDLNKLRLEGSSSAKFSGKYNEKSYSFEGSTESVSEFSLEKKFAYLSRKESEKTVINGKTVESKEEHESWYYMKGESFFMVSRDVVGGKETKEYSEYTGAYATAYYASVFGTAKETAIGLLAGTDSLTECVGMLKQTEKEAKSEGCTYKVGAYSSGEGSLIIKGKAVATKFEVLEFVEAEGNGSARLKFVWDNYKFVESSYSYSFTAKDSAKKVEGKISGKSNSKVSDKVNLATPDLKGYTKK